MKVKSIFFKVMFIMTSLHSSYEGPDLTWNNLDCFVEGGFFQFTCKFDINFS